MSANQKAMFGKCVNCGCTAFKPCVSEIAGEAVPCRWVDRQQTLCSRCVNVILSGPLEPTDLAEASLMLRSLRSVCQVQIAHLAELEALVMHIAGNQGILEGSGGIEPGGIVTAAELAGGIWTPEF